MNLSATSTLYFASSSFSVAVMSGVSSMLSSVSRRDGVGVVRSESWVTVPSSA